MNKVNDIYQKRWEKSDKSQKLSCKGTFILDKLTTYKKKQKLAMTNSRVLFYVVEVEVKNLVNKVKTFL